MGSRFKCGNRQMTIGSSKNTIKGRKIIWAARQAKCNFQSERTSGQSKIRTWWMKNRRCWISEIGGASNTQRQVASCAPLSSLSVVYLHLLLTDQMPSASLQRFHLYHSVSSGLSLSQRFYLHSPTSPPSLQLKTGSVFSLFFVPMKDYWLVPLSTLNLLFQTHLGGVNGMAI